MVMTGGGGGTRHVNGANELTMFLPPIRHVLEGHPVLVQTETDGGVK